MSHTLTERTEYRPQREFCYRCGRCIRSQKIISMIHMSLNPTFNLYSKHTNRCNLNVLKSKLSRFKKNIVSIYCIMNVSLCSLVVWSVLLVGDISLDVFIDFIILPWIFDCYTPLKIILKTILFFIIMKITYNWKLLFMKFMILWTVVIYYHSLSHMSLMKIFSI